jgi:hypothetical protein
MAIVTRLQQAVAIMVASWVGKRKNIPKHSETTTYPKNLSNWQTSSQFRNSPAKEKHNLSKCVPLSSTDSNKLKYPPRLVDTPQSSR